MVPLKGEWTHFIDHQDQLEHYRLWGLIPEKSKRLRPIMVTDGYLGVPEPCMVVGYQGSNWAVIQLSDGLHAIHGEYLAELQPIAHQKLPFGACFVEILEKYVVIDIETTGLSFHDDRIIEIAAIIYEYGKKVSTYQTLVNPDMLIPPDIVSLTGITQEDVKQAPSLSEIKGDFLSFIGDMPIVGHNALTFDVPFLRAQFDADIRNTVIDTLPMAKKVFSLLNCHKLAYLDNALGLGSVGAHRALQDAETTNALLWACLSPRRHESAVKQAYLSEHIHPISTTKKKPRRSSKSGTIPARNYEKVDIKTIRPSCECINSNHPLFGKNIVFTGSLSIPRDEAMQLAVDAGAILKTTVSAKTAYLVVGRQDITLVGMDGMSSKEEKAHALNESGKANIQIINEDEFLGLTKKEGAPV